MPTLFATDLTRSPSSFCAWLRFWPFTRGRSLVVYRTNLSKPFLPPFGCYYHDRMRTKSFYTPTVLWMG